MIYVDDYLVPASVRSGSRVITDRWSHLFTDGDLEELHRFAQRIGLRRSWFQDGKPEWAPHYDVTSGKRELAIMHGARAVTSVAGVSIQHEAHGRGLAAMSRARTDELVRRMPDPEGEAG